MGGGRLCCVCLSSCGCSSGGLHAIVATLVCAPVLLALETWQCLGTFDLSSVADGARRLRPRPLVWSAHWRVSHRSCDERKALEARVEAALCCSTARRYGVAGFSPSFWGKLTAMRNPNARVGDAPLLERQSLLLQTPSMDITASSASALLSGAVVSHAVESVEDAFLGEREGSQIGKGGNVTTMHTRWPDEIHNILRGVPTNCATRLHHLGTLQSL